MTIVLMLLLSSCMKGDSMMFIRDKDTGLAESRMKQLVNAIKQQDEEAIKELFSEKAIEEAGDIDSNVADLLSFVRGEVVSWTQDGSPVVFEDFEYGSVTKELLTWYDLKTSEESYRVLLDDYPIDTVDSKNVGLYSIMILRAEDEDKLESWGGSNAGVYILEN